MSDIGQLRTAAHEASAEFDRAQNAANYARTSQTNYAFAERQWKLSHTYEDREPLPIIEGKSKGMPATTSPSQPRPQTGRSGVWRRP